MISIFSRAKLQKIISASLAVWLSGFVFLLCCGKMEAKAAEAEFCPLAKGSSHCRKTKSNETQTTFSSESGSSFDCCNFFPAIFDKVRKLEKNQQMARITDKIKVEHSQSFSIKTDSPFAEFYSPPILYAAKLHIKNRVLRI